MYVIKKSPITDPNTKILLPDTSGHLLKMICQNRSTVTSDLRVRRQFFTLWSMIFEVFLAELVIRQHDFAFALGVIQQLRGKEEGEGGSAKSPRLSTGGGVP